MWTEPAHDTGRSTSVCTKSLQNVPHERWGEAGQALAGDSLSHVIMFVSETLENPRLLNAKLAFQDVTKDIRPGGKKISLYYSFTG